VSLLANLGRVLASDAVLSTLDQANATAPATSTLKLSADLHWRRKEWMAAIEAASRVIYREPKDFHALAILVTSYGHLEQYEAAQVYAKQLVLLRPPSWTATKTVLNLLRFFRLFTADGRAIQRRLILKCDEEAQADRAVLAWAHQLIAPTTITAANDRQPAV